VTLESLLLISAHRTVPRESPLFGVLLICLALLPTSTTFLEGIAEPAIPRAGGLALDLEAHGENFAVFRRNYFWIDLFPKNDGSFPDRLPDCLTDAK
jgi:hypothetical protein